MTGDIASALDSIEGLDPITSCAATAASAGAEPALLRDEVSDAGPVLAGTAGQSAAVEGGVEGGVEGVLVAGRAIVRALALSKIETLEDQIEELRDSLEEIAERYATVVSMTTMTPAQAADVVATFAASFVEDPAGCIDGLLASLFEALGAQIVDVWTYLAGVARWAYRLSLCAQRAQVELDELDLVAMAHVVVDDESCAWLRDFVEKTVAVDAYLERLDAELTAWSDAVSEQPSLVLDAILVLLELEEDVLDELFGGGTYYEWLKEQATDAAQLCSRLGSILGFMVFQLLWAMVGGSVSEAGAVGRALWQIANAPLPSLPDDSARLRARRSRPSAVVAAAKAGPRSPRRELGRLLDDIGPEGRRLLTTILQGLARGKLKLTKRITNQRLKAVLVTLEKHAELASATAALRVAVASGFVRARYAFAPFRQLDALERHLNRGTNGLRYLTLVEQGVGKLDRAEELAESAAQLTVVFERAHAIDQRLWPHVEPAFEAAGVPWQDVDDIVAMLLPAADHTGNPLRCLARASGLGEAELGSFNEYKSLTGFLTERIVWDKPPPSPPSPPFFVLTPSSTARQVVDAHAEIWRLWGVESGAGAGFEAARAAMFDHIRALIVR